MTPVPGFDISSTQIARLSKHQEIVDSCSQLMAETLLKNGKILCVGSDMAKHNAQQFSALLLHNPDQPRPALPSLCFGNDALGSQSLQALGDPNDFVILFCGLDQARPFEQTLDHCLDHSLTSVMFVPDRDEIFTTDKALEIRLEYNSMADYLTTLSAISGYLIHSIEKQLFGGQT